MLSIVLSEKTPPIEKVLYFILYYCATLMHYAEIEPISGLAQPYPLDIVLIN